MGKSSKKVTIAYKIYLGLHTVWCHGPIDSFQRLLFDKKLAYTGNVTANGTVTVSAPNLFGGDPPSGEGGVGGDIDFLNGADDQTPNSYLVSQLGSDVPGFIRVVSLIFKSFYMGQSQYLKNVSARFSRIHVRTAGVAQWYDEKAELLLPGAFGKTSDGWDYQQLPEETDPANENLTIPTSGWISGGVAPFAGGTASGNTNWTPHTVLWIKKTFSAMDSWTLHVEGDNGFVVFVDGNIVGTINAANGNDPGNYFGDYTVPSGTHELVIKCFDELSSVWGSGGGAIAWATLGPPSGDMNAAHMIRECLTDQEWGMGYLESDIDDTSFTTAADTLYDEAMGLSLLWDQSQTIEDFVNLASSHVNGMIYADRKTGKFVFKLIRNDYDVNTIPILDQSNIKELTDYTIRTEEELINSVTVQYWDNNIDQQGSVTETDPALVQQWGQTINTTVQYPGFTNSGNASRAALRDLMTLSSPLVSCSVTCDRTAKDWNPGDVFKLVWPEFGSGYIVMRILTMQLGTGQTNRIVLTVTQDQFALPAQGTTTNPDPVWVDPIGPPAAATNRIVIEAPYYELIQRESQSDVDTELANNPELGIILASAARPTSGCVNAGMWLDDGSGYNQVAVTDFSPTAKLSADCGRLDTILHVAPVSDWDLLEVGNHIQLGDELMRIDAFDLVANTITVGRGILDTVPTSHFIDDVLMSWDAFAVNAPTDYSEGETVNVKLTPSSSLGSMDVASVPADAVVMNSRAVKPYPPGQVVVAGSNTPVNVAGTFNVTWADRNRQTQADQLVDFTEAGVTAGPNTRYGLEFYDATSTLIIGRSDIYPGTASVALNYTGNVTMKLWTIDDNGASIQQHEIIFAYTGAGPNSITATAYTPVDDSTIINGGGDP